MLKEGPIDEVGKEGRRPSILRQCAAGMLGWTTGIWFGLSVGYVSAGMDSLQQEHMAGTAPFPIENADIGTFGSVMNLGILVAAPVSGYAARRLGRKIPALLSNIPYVVGWVLIAFPVNFYMMVAGQALCCFALGFRTPCTRMYLAEISHPRHRARFLACVYAISGAFQVAVYLAALVLNWQKLAIACAIVPLVFLILAEWRIPESHVWLLSRGRAEEARKSMQWTYGDEYNLDQDFDEAVSHQKDTAEVLTHWKDLLSPRYTKPILIMSGFMLLRQFTGGNAIFLFMSQIFRQAGKTLDVRYCIIVLGAVGFVCTSLSGWIMDKLGRRNCVMISGILMGLAETAVGAHFYLAELPETKEFMEKISWLLLVLLSLSMLGYTIGLATLNDVMMSEVVPLQIKNEANAILSFMNNALGYLGLVAFHYFLSSVHASGTFWIFASCCFLVVGFFFAFLPETKGKSLGNIERALSGPGLAAGDFVNKSRMK